MRKKDLWAKRIKTHSAKGIGHGLRRSFGVIKRNGACQGRIIKEVEDLDVWRFRKDAGLFGYLYHSDRSAIDDWR